MAENKQLTRIVAPNINEVDYADKMQTVFNNINENFAKIASLPFIQGVQGDSYQLIEKPIWNISEDDSNINNATLTREGAVLLSSIFGKDFTDRDPQVGNPYTFYEVRNGTDTEHLHSLADLTIGVIESIRPNGVNPIDFFELKYTEEEIEGSTVRKYYITNNNLYFYVIVDDAGEEQQKQLGQYYYFIDARLKVIGELYYSANGFSSVNFSDYTGFYQYLPDTDEYIKIDILPSLYYDKTKNDICWKFNGSETGISAIGIPGADGLDATLQIVHVTLNSGQHVSNTASAKVDGLFKRDTTNVENPGWWGADSDYFKENLHEGNSIICIQYSPNTELDEQETEENLYIAYGEVAFSENGEDKIAYWNKDTVLEKVMSFEKINSYFYNMRAADVRGTVPVNSPQYIPIPALTDTNNYNYIPAHVISSVRGDNANLNFQYISDAFEGDGKQKGITGVVETGSRKAIFKNYNVDVERGSLSVRDTITSVTGEVIVGATSATSGPNGYLKKEGANFKIELKQSPSGSIIVKNDKSNITVKTGIVEINPELKVTGPVSITKTLSVTGKTTLYDDLTISGEHKIDAKDSNIYSQTDVVRDHIKFAKNAANEYFHYIGAAGVNQNVGQDQFGGSGSRIDILAKQINLKQNTSGGVSDVHVYGNQEIHNNLTVDWNSTIKGNETVKGNLDVDGCSSASYFNVPGFKANFSSMTPTGAAKGTFSISWSDFIKNSYTSGNGGSCRCGKYGIYAKSNSTIATEGAVTYTINIDGVPNGVICPILFKMTRTNAYAGGHILAINGKIVYSFASTGGAGCELKGLLINNSSGQPYVIY